MNTQREQTEPGAIHEIEVPGRRGFSVNWSRVIGNIGRTLIGGGTLILLFVVYQLWGTSIHEQRAQNKLESEFATAFAAALGPQVDQLALDTDSLPASIAASAVVPVTPIADAVPARDEPFEPDVTGAFEVARTEVIDTSFLPAGLLSPEFGPPPPPAEDGDAVALIRIPRIGVTKTVVEGVTTDALKDGPGHYPGTPLPGQAGNAAIAGHRTTYGHPFLDVDDLVENDLIYVTTLQGSFVYRVTEKLIVSPKDVFVLDASQDNRLTLTTCHPRYSARKRLVIVAELIGEPADNSSADVSVPGEVTLASEDFTAESATTSIIPAPVETEEAVDQAVTTTAIPRREISTTAAARQEITTTTAAPAPVFTEVAHGGIDGEAGDRLPALLLGLLAASSAFGIWYLAQRWKQWTTYALGTPVFLVVLFFFFESFSSLLPPGV